jgi:transcriptional regulator with XRE-family HTH domain
MNTTAALIHPEPDDASLLTKAFLRAADLLGLNQKEVAQVLGKSEPTVSRLTNKTVQLDPVGKEWEIALIFLRIYRSLDALFGGHEADLRAWFTTHNRALGGIPRDLIKNLQGLFLVIQYLDAMRGKI